MEDRVVLEIEINDDDAQNFKPGLDTQGGKAERAAQRAQRDFEPGLDMRGGAEDAAMRSSRAAKQARDSRGRFTSSSAASEAASLLGDGGASSEARTGFVDAASEVFSHVSSGAGAAKAGAAARTSATAAASAAIGAPSAAATAALAPAAIAATAAMTGAAAAAWGLKEGLSAAKEAAEFSGEVFAAQTVREREDIISKIEQSREIGPELANMVDAQGQLEVEIRELKTEVLRQILPPLSELVANTATIIGLLGDTAKVVESGNFVSNGVTAAARNMGLAPEGVKLAFYIFKRIASKWEQNDAEKKRDATLQRWNDFLDPVKVEARLKDGKNL